MESSMNSRSKPLSSYSGERAISSNFEESGWTMYFEDFFAGNNHNNDEYSSFSRDYGISSVVSDAASLVVKKPADKKGVVGLFCNGKGYGRLSLKKRRINEALVDDALEDTASSPVNSPKVYDGLMGQFKNTKQKDNKNIQDEGDAQGQLVEEEAKLGLVVKRENDNTELKKKGLCVVPLSTIVNFFG